MSISLWGDVGVDDTSLHNTVERKKQYNTQHCMKYDTKMSFAVI
jgi:hypothetical protein